MILYHFTSAAYEQSIRDIGIVSYGYKIKTGLFPMYAIATPEQFPGEDSLIWLTRTPMAAVIPPWSHDLLITVDTDNASRWVQWAHKHQVPKRWRESLRRSAAGFDERDWYVSTETIPPDEIVSIQRLVRVNQVGA